MRVIRSIHPAVCACAMTLAVAPGLSAQEDSSARPELQEIGQEGQAAAKERKEAKHGGMTDQQELGRAHLAGIQQAKALEQLMSQPQEQQDKALIAAKTQALGQSLESAREYLTAAEALTPEKDKTRETFDEIREKHESALEHYRALVQKTNYGQLTPEAADDIGDEANDIVEDLTVAEQERMKLPGVKPEKKKGAPEMSY